MRTQESIEAVLQDAIALLERNGFPMAAESLKDNLRAIHVAPTGAARRRRLFQLSELLQAGEPGPSGWSARFPGDGGRATLQAIQEILAREAGAEADPDDWSPPLGRVA